MATTTYLEATKPVSHRLALDKDPPDALLPPRESSVAQSFERHQLGLVVGVGLTR